MRIQEKLTRTHYYAHIPPMGAPRKKTKKVRTNLTMDPALKGDAEQFAFQKNESLSELVERLLAAEIAADQVESSRQLLGTIRASKGAALAAELEASKRASNKA